MVISTEAPTEAPSYTREQIHTILTPANVRKQYNKTITCYKNLNNTRTTMDFLQSSLKSKIIPPTFIIKNTFYNNTETNDTKVKNLLHQTSNTLIKITIDSLKTKEHNQFNIHLNELHILLNLIPDQAGKDLVLDRMTNMESRFREKTTERSIKRLKWLKQKEPNNQKAQIPKDTPTCTPACAPTCTHKHKKHRRFVKRTKWRRTQTKKKAQQITAVYNYSAITLTSSMSKILNRGLNFCVTPTNLNVTELLVDYRKFERKMKWKEFFHDKDKDNTEYIPPIFPKEKSNLPPKGGTSLNNFLIGVKSEMTGTKLNKARPNISDNETKALETLTNLQKSRQIVIKPCDKGAGIIICNYDDYVTSCEKDLSGKTPNNEPHYSKITSKDLNIAKSKITDTLNSAHRAQQITTQELNEMLPTEKDPGKFYHIFKVHKKHNAPNLPPGRPIVSGCNSITEKISEFVDYHSKHLVPLMPSYLQDTPDLLRQIQILNNTPLPPNSFPVSIDVVGLYSNIPTEEGIAAMERALEKRQDKTVTTKTLIELLTHVLKLNIFEFNAELFIQNVGTAMGTKAAPTIANIFMAEIDVMIKNCGKNLIHFYRRYIDDIFIIWTGSKDEFDQFVNTINALHQTIKFTSDHNFDNKSTTFLDLTVSIKDNKIKTDLYRKETDKIQYLLPSSCHPAHTFRSVPYSLALRLLRICSDTKDLETRFKELEEMLLSRNYNKNIIKNAIKNVAKLDRTEILKRANKPKTDRIVLAVTYHPKLPSISNIIKKHWQTMTKDPVAKEIFPKPPMMAFRQPPNLKRRLCQAKLPQRTTKQKRQLKGTKPCNKPCGICPYVLESKEFISTATKERFKMTGTFNCTTKGIIYVTTCSKCLKQYVGQTGRRLSDRIREHLNCICLQKEVTGIHYNTPGHNHSNFQVQVIEKVSPNTPNYRLEREEMWIKKLSTKNPHGLNKHD